MCIENGLKTAEMNLVKETWNEKDIEKFRTFSKSLKEKDSKKGDWEQKIVGTKLECFGKTSEKAKMVAMKIRKGNFLSFVQNLQIENFFDSLLVAHLISKIKDFSVFENQLNRFIPTIDNWASCDVLNFKNRDKNKLLNLAQKYILNKKIFIRRVGIRIYFELIRDEKYLDECFKMLDGLAKEKEHYVNMCASWLLCECFVKHREHALKYFANNNTNSFVINKAISKCRDSFRISVYDKQLLLEFKKLKD